MTDLPVNIDTTYPDDPSDPSTELHQEHHDLLHALHNAIAGTAPDLASLGIAASGTSPTVKWLSLTRFETIAGAPARTDVNDWPGWSFANGANGVVATTISGSDMDEWGLDWATFDIEFWWINAGAGAGNVRMYDYAADVVADGGTASLGSLGGSTVAAPAQNVVEVTTVKSGIAVPTTAQIQRIAVGRNGASGADTLANAVLGVGVMLRKAS